MRQLLIVVACYVVMGAVLYVAHRWHRYVLKRDKGKFPGTVREVPIPPPPPPPQRDA